MKTRIFTLIMSLFIATMAFAYDAEIDGIYYNLDAENKIAEVTRGDEHYMGDIVIPSSIVSDGVTYSVTSIGEYAIGYYNGGNGNINSISIPKTIEFIGKGAFMDCYNLVAVYITDVSAWCKIEFSPETISANPLYYAETLYINNEKVTTLVIPEGVDTIKSLAFQGAPISSFVFPESLVYVAEDAFSGSIWWENLPQGSIYAGKIFLEYVDYGEDYVGEKETHIDIKEGTKIIAPRAFAYSSLTSITIPNSVTEVGGGVFYHCRNLKSVVLSENMTSLPMGTNKTNNGWVDYGFFEGCELLESITIPNSVTSIGNRAFAECTALTSITIPNSVTEVGGGVFYGCSSLKSVVLSENMTSLPIGNKKESWGESYYYGFFERCSSLTSIEIPNSVTEIGSSAFNNCTSLTSITIPNSVTEVGGGVFYGCESLQSVVLSENMTSLPMGTNNGWGDYGFFEGCELLESITIPNKVTLIGYDAFNGCRSLMSVKIPNSVTDIQGRAFYGCSSLTSIEIPNSVTEIRGGAFSHCIALTSIEIPNSVTYLGSEAFANCYSLRYAKLGSGFNANGEDGYLDNNLFYCEDDYVWVGDENEENGEYMLMTTSLDTLICEFGDDAGIDIYGDEHPLYGTTKLRYFQGPAKLVNSIKEENQTQFSNKLTEVHITDGELDENGFNYINRSKKSLHTIDLAGTINTAINDLAFYDCYKLENLMLPGNLETIGFKAVAECYQLKEINIPASVVEINDAAFENCRSIKSITFGGQAEAKSFASRMKRAAASGDVALQRIGNWAFYNCHALENLVIPEGVTEVGDAAFYGCTYLDSLTLPLTTQRIGDNCFALCSRMKQINVNAIEPPTIFAKTFFDVNRNIPVIVPEGAREAYANDEYWGEFINVVESGEDTSIENAENANVAIYSVGGVLYVDGLLADYQVFDVNGRLVYSGRDAQLQLPRGVYVVVVEGEVEKVVL